MSSSYGHHAASGPSPGGQASFHPGAYSNISPLAPLRKSTQVPSQLMGSSHSKSSNPGPSSFKAAVSGGIGFKRVFASKRKKSLDLSARSAEHDLPRPVSTVDTSPETLNIIVKKSVAQHNEPSSPPPLPPKPLPTVVNQSKSLNRASILPISPGISPAVNYMLQQQQIPSPDATTSQPQPQPQPQPQQSAPAPKETEKIKPQNTPDNVEMKESWRKSDSTNSHTTVRPGGNGGSARTSRPVSVAESFQSTHTVVQASNKRLSALITDGMPEEDGESFVSVDDNSSSRPSKPIPPLSSDKVKNRRSMSLNLGPPTNSKTPVTAPLASASVTVLEHSLSQVVSPPTMLNTAQSLSPTRLSLAPPPSTSVDTGVGQQQPRTTVATSGVNNFRGKFVAWANSNLSSDNLSRQDRSLPPMPPQQRRPSLPHFAGDGAVPSPPTSTPTPLRQTTTSMSGSGLGPVKRAVEKMGWKWGMSLSSSTSGSGSGYSSSSSSTNAPSSRTSDYGLVRTSSNRSTPSVHSHIVKSSHSQGSAVGLAGGVSGKRTPDAPSGAYSVHSITSKSDNDPFASSSGPSLGTMLRGALRNKSGVVSSGVVFGKALKIATRETGVNVRKMGSVGMGGGRVKEGLVLELERRLLPAIVVRCAQHLLIWGVQEEGLFRLSGRPSHVSKLRSEFDSGVDYDMTECSPGDLDPHAVASVFKAYLRELPESILTHAFSPLFDAAIKKEASTNLNSLEASRSSGVGRGNNGKPGLPQGPKSGFAVRKPPSLSTLSMPTFSGIPPPSTSLVAEIKSLVSKLPQENYDLLRTVVDLVKATGKESTKTKMPLSNLMLVFCPSLNMAPPLLKVFCEAEGIWAEVMDSPHPPPLPSKDGQFVKREEKAEMTDSSEEMEEDDEDEVEGKSLMSSERASLDTTDDPSSGYHASAEEEAFLFEGQITRRRHLPERKTDRSEIPTIYLDTMSHYSSSSGSSLREPLEPSGRHHHHCMDSKDTDDDDDESISPASGLVHLVPPVLSPSTPLCSSSAESVAHPISESSASLSQLKEDGVGPIEIVDPDPIPISFAPMTTPTKKTSIGHRSDDNAVQFPQLLSTPSLRQKRMSIPLLSLPTLSPSFIASSGDADRLRDDDSPCPSPTSPITGVHMLNKRSKRPSLRLLFSKSKKSGSSLNSLGDRSGNGIVVISNPIKQHLPRSPAWDSGTSDSSGSTPISAVTAASGMSSLSHLPPVLDTPIDGSPLSLDLGFTGSPPDTAIPDRGMREQQKLAKVDVDATSPSPTVTPAILSMSENTRLEEVPQTPIASRLSEAPPYPVTMIPAISYPSLDDSPGSPPSPSVPKRPSLSFLQTSPLDSGLVISSAHSPQLSLFDDGVEEDWTQSVLSAANKL